MKKWLLFLSVLSSGCLASEMVYLNCNGVVTDMELNQKVKTVENDFVINRNEKYIQQIITGLTEEQTKNLRFNYKETPTQYVSVDGSLSINRHTLEYTFDGPMGISVNGRCKVLKPAI